MIWRRRANGFIWVLAWMELWLNGRICRIKPVNAPACRKLKSNALQIALSADFVTWRKSRKSARCCWDFIMRKVSWTTWGSARRFRARNGQRLTKKLEALIKPPGFTGKAPGGESRWSTKHSMEWQPLETKLVAEVQFDHFTGGRFRHGTKFLRWRPDKAPKDCKMEQVKRENKSALNLL